MNLGQSEYRKRYDNLSARYQKAGARVKEIEAACADRKVKRSGIDAFIASLMAADKGHHRVKRNLMEHVGRPGDSLFKERLKSYFTQWH